MACPCDHDGRTRCGCADDCPRHCDPRLRERIIDLERELATCCEANEGVLQAEMEARALFLAAKARVQQMEAECRALFDALVRYGRCLPMCPSAAGTLTGAQCTCGLLAALEVRLEREEAPK